MQDYLELGASLSNPQEYLTLLDYLVYPFVLIAFQNIHPVKHK